MRGLGDRSRIGQPGGRLVRDRGGAGRLRGADGPNADQHGCARGDRLLRPAGRAGDRERPVGVLAIEWRKLASVCVAARNNGPAIRCRERPSIPMRALRSGGTMENMERVAGFGATSTYI